MLFQYGMIYYIGATMKIHIKITKDEITKESIIESFEMITADKLNKLGLLPVNEVVVDASTVPVSFYKEWFYYKVDKYSKQVLQFSPKLYAKYNSGNTTKAVR